MRISILVFCLSCLISVTGVNATTWHVPGDAMTIQAGIYLASAGDTVLVRCGAYQEASIMMRSDICLLSETGEADCVTIDAQGVGAVFHIESVPEGPTIKGFTITGGYGFVGGGLVCWGSSPVLTDCAFIGNFAGWGTGMSSVEGSSPILERVTFDSNETSYDGGAMYCEGGTVTLIDVRFSNNSGASWGGLVLDNCTSATLTRVTFAENAMGAASFFGCAPTMTGCTLYGNVGSNAITCSDGASPVLEQTIIAFNTGGPAIDCGDDQLVLQCCDIYGNEGGDWVGCIEDQYGISGNISEDPLFCDPEYGDLTLYSNSPCLPGNHPDGADCGTIGAHWMGCGGTAVEQTTWGWIKAGYR